MTFSDANCFTCQSRRRTEWCVLSEDELGVIDKAKKSRTLGPGEILFHQGDPCGGIHCIENGLIGARKLDADGNSILLGMAYPGDTLGYRFLLSGEDYQASAEALKPSTVCYIDQSAIRFLLEKNPALGLRFLQRAARDLNEAEDRFLQSVTLSVRARFAHLLLVLKKRYEENGVPRKTTEFSMDLPLSRQDMAALIGIRPETMSRTIRQFEEEGIARFSGRRVHVPHTEKLLGALETDNIV
ncbi:MAG: Crp/Fnr family transcriptional regulator [Rhodospirillales bacterium]